MKITYFHTLYQREVTEFIRDGEIVFRGGYAYFHAGGHGYAIELIYIRSIESLGGLE